MKHYFSHDANGRLVGIHCYHHEGTKLGGWPDHIRPDDEDAEHEAARSLRKEQLGGANGAVEFIVYNCPCPPTMTRCACPSMKLGIARVVDGKLVDKKAGGLLVDGALVADGATIKRPPGSKVMVSIVCVGVINTSAVTIYQTPQVRILDADKPIQLVFTDGQSEGFELVAPVQGLTGAIRAIADDVQPLTLHLLGWSA